MSLTESQIIDVALEVNSPISMGSLDIKSQIIDVAFMMSPPSSVDILDIRVPTINVVATNSGPRGPKGDSGEWVALTQSEYDALNPPDPDVLYVIIQ